MTREKIRYKKTLHISNILLQYWNKEGKLSQEILVLGSIDRHALHLTSIFLLKALYNDQNKKNA
jgi:hypothetical protein